jgi:hypothetical protein
MMTFAYCSINLLTLLLYFYHSQQATYVVRVLVDPA